MRVVGPRERAAVPAAAVEELVVAAAGEGESMGERFVEILREHATQAGQVTAQRAGTGRFVHV